MEACKREAMDKRKEEEERWRNETKRSERRRGRERERGCETIDSGAQWRWGRVYERIVNSN